MLSLTITGNVGRDPAELRTVEYERDGEQRTAKVTSFSLAVDNGKDQPPTWVKVNVWNGLAETVAKYVKKGYRVTVCANRIKSSAWQDESGELRSGIEVTAMEVDFRGNRRSEEQPDEPDMSDIPF